ncbi:bifunctional adenosylcobinamide kinase/adenosylcobinamide-phosphate guanylyltransferase [Clostridium luticellarii]|jgi:adenosylcobinamide kinase/adenosylcobinamide-phosphate guanylyltransferase|uniref:Adenosylcobinamide kinase n=1 Tax=Clostridium luticellarii TaxID=1691940 RepID=A0A2T0BQ82_9CLOT|nr:bifunctional adenosylcobinamide kinase/adenosylcobinamide-phosphate guanylyltransferase [Clostridium luticellarii]MCI1944460.1 bifunctional adenosylcobinamide kinase/adenosylcobinamide-phosphate guanylyltransferase [Clostridium luticellarii]MCI1967959.1 bifunctional adenosylcobinamide kinase/adenosylcobinamide-phosphate guanylyltransferase [Clostridium luticellarii]MCI1995102.1 bifunctional adenosylcobinamide kinase/adenosylcobinamide-phosphate guanylyltransferase [Clostridium luticellarii]M
MGKIVLITGGSRSGKSTFAEKLLKDKEEVLYIATAVATDDEMKNRIKKHKSRRNPNWKTYEGYRGLGDVIKNATCQYVMLECIGTMITNMIFEKKIDIDNITADEIKILEDSIMKEIEHIISSVNSGDKNILIVTNEVGLSVIPEYKLGRIFVDILGRANQFIAQSSDEVYLVVCGLSLKLK